MATSMVEVHPFEERATALSEAVLVDDGIEAMMEKRDGLLSQYRNYPEPLRSSMATRAAQLNEEIKRAQMELWAFMLTNGLSYADFPVNGESAITVAESRPDWFGNQFADGVPS